MAEVVPIRTRREYKDALEAASTTAEAERLAVEPIDPHGFALGMRMLAAHFGTRMDEQALDNYYVVLSSRCTMGDFVRALTQARQGERMLSPADLLDLALEEP